MFGTITLVEPSENSFLPFAGGNLLSTFRHGTVLFGMCVDEKVSSPGGPPKLWYYRNLAVAISHPTHSDNRKQKTKMKEETMMMMLDEEGKIALSSFRG